MRKCIFRIILCSVLVLVSLSCAKRGRIGGGEKDTSPPKMVRAFPDNYTLNFSDQEINIYFDEYIKLKDIQKQLVISPPLKYDPIISPLGAASKYISIKIRDTLPKNTTYSFNFGQSITDNNEGNPLSYFKYVFSTGSYIDSLSLKGTINDAEKRLPEEFASVMLYKIDSTFTDSIIYKEKPTYITNTLDSINVFELENLKAGSYLLLALKEENPNYIYNQHDDKIGFLKDYIQIPSDSSFNLKLFKETPNFKAGKPKVKTKSNIAFGYEGNSEHLEINLLTETGSDFSSVITKDILGDTLSYWYKPVFELDSVFFELRNKKKIVDTFKVRPRKIPNDSLRFNATRGTLKFDEQFEISANNPIANFDLKKITILDKDSTKLVFKSSFDSLKNTLQLSFDLTEENSYRVEILPDAISDFFNNKNDTLRYNLSTRTYADYGNVRVRIKNVPEVPLIVQLVDAKGAVNYELKGTKNDLFDFRHITPAKYFLRVILDENGNNRFDTGNYLKKVQPERISYFPKELDVRPNWDFEEIFTLK